MFGNIYDTFTYIQRRFPFFIFLYPQWYGCKGNSRKPCNKAFRESHLRFSINSPPPPPPPPHDFIMEYLMTTIYIILKERICWYSYFYTSGLCKIGCPSETHLKPKYSEISPTHNQFLKCSIVLKICTEHGSNTAVLCAKFQNDWINRNGCCGRTKLHELWVYD